MRGQGKKIFFIKVDRLENVGTMLYGVEDKDG